MQRRLIILIVGAVLALVLMHLGTHFPYATGMTIVCFVVVATMMLLRSMWAESRRLSASQSRLDEICLRCGYDLRATPDQCPECGLRVE